MVAVKPRKGDFGQVRINTRPSNPYGEGLPANTRPSDNPFTDARPLVKTLRYIAPIAMATANDWHLIGTDIVAKFLRDIRFAPQAVEIINYSDQAIRIKYACPYIESMTKQFDLECPGRFYMSDAIDPNEMDVTSIGVAISGWGSVQNPRLLIIRFYSQPLYSYSISALPADLTPNAMETYEKSVAVAAGLTPGGDLAAGVTDSYLLANESDTLVLSAEATAMQFSTGKDSGDLTNNFTLFSGDVRALALRVGYVQVKNLDAVNPGGYRIWNMYTNQQL